jgi:hypothetical protein
VGEKAIDCALDFGGAESGGGGGDAALGFDLFAPILSDNFGSGAGGFGG